MVCGGSRREQGMDRVGSAIVAHHVWHHGGETKVALDTLSAFCDDGLDEVYVAASAKPVSGYEEVISKTCARDLITYLPFRIESFTIAQRSLLWRAVIKIVKRISGRSLIWIDNSAYKPLTGLRAQGRASLLEYVYFPYEMILKRDWDFLPEDLRREAEEYFTPLRANKLKWKYIKWAVKAESRYRRENPFEDADKVLAVSEWTALILRHLYGGKAIVNQPAVDTREFSSARSRGFEDRVNQVVSIGRISPEKRYEDVITAVGESETRPRLVIIGGLSRSKVSYLKFLEAKAREYGVDLVLIPNAPRNRIVEELSSARVYVHAARGEHFGITVIEAMAAGVPVIVHRSGGPYHDIIRRGEYGLYYMDTRDLAEKIDILASDEKVWNHYSRVAWRRSEYYSYGRFKGQLSRILEEIGIL